MKAFALLVMVLALSLPAAASRIGFGNAEQVDNFIIVGIKNNNDYDIEDAKIRAFIPEIDMITSSADVDLDDGERTPVSLYFIDDVPDGEYLVRISVREGSGTTTAYRHVYFE